MANATIELTTVSVATNEPLSADGRFMYILRVRTASSIL